MPQLYSELLLNKYFAEEAEREAKRRRQVEEGEAMLQTFVARAVVRTRASLTAGATA